MECASNDCSCDMINWNHVDSVVDVRSGLELDATLEHTDQEIIGIGHTSLGITQDVAWSNDTPAETSSTSLAAQIFRHPLTLAISCSKSLATTLEIVFLTDAFATGSHDPFRFKNEMIMIENACR